MDKGGQESRYVKILADIDLIQPLVRGTKLKYKDTKIWIQFKYEQLLVFCYYCGCVDHNKRLCEAQKEDVLNKKLKEL